MCALMATENQNVCDCHEKIVVRNMPKLAFFNVKTMLRYTFFGLRYTFFGLRYTFFGLLLHLFGGEAGGRYTFLEPTTIESQKV